MLAKITRWLKMCLRCKQGIPADGLAFTTYHKSCPSCIESLQKSKEFFELINEGWDEQFGPKPSWDGIEEMAFVGEGGRDKYKKMSAMVD